VTATYRLRPCPMCRSTELKHYTTESVQSFRRGTVKCKRCGCMVRAGGGGHELFAQLGIIPNNDGRYSMADYEVVRRESNDRARRLSAAKWNGG
jgi:hypothetical protein